MPDRYNCVQAMNRLKGTYVNEKAKRLREMLSRPGPVVSLGVWDAFSAIVAEQEGFELLTLFGSMTSWSLIGKPDSGIIGACSPRQHLCQNLVGEAASSGEDVYMLMNREAAKAPVGSNRLLFNPSLAGGNSQDSSVNLRGGYVGLDLKHGQPELIRAAMEGIAMNLRLRLDLLRKYTWLEDEILFVGGGAKSRFYLGIFADVFNYRIIKSTIDQDAAALGAAALAAVGCRIWEDFTRIDRIHKTVELVEPVPENRLVYERLLPVFEHCANSLAQTGDMLHKIDFDL